MRAMVGLAGPRTVLEARGVFAPYVYQLVVGSILQRLVVSDCFADDVTDMVTSSAAGR